MKMSITKQIFNSTNTNYYRERFNPSSPQNKSADFCLNHCPRPDTPCKGECKEILKLEKELYWENKK